MNLCPCVLPWALPRHYRDRQAAQRRGAGPWIIKPVRGARGQGLTVMPRMDRPLPSLVQRYVTDPLLLEGRKFHLRLYLVISSLDPLRVLVFREGLLLLSSKNWSADPSLYADRKMQFSNSAIATNTGGNSNGTGGNSNSTGTHDRDGVPAFRTSRMVSEFWGCTATSTSF